MNNDIERTVKNIFDDKAGKKISQAKLEKRKSIEDLSNRLFEFIEQVCWRTESNLAKALDTSERQIKYAKVYLQMTNRITINEYDNKNRSNPSHYITKHCEVQEKVITPEQPKSPIKWRIFNNLKPEDFSLMTIEEQLDIYEEMRMPFIPLHFPKFKKGLTYCSCNAGRYCDAVGKHPAVCFKDLDFTKKSTYNEMKSHWAERDNRFNIAFLTRDFAVIDVDFRHGGAFSLETIEEIYGEFPRTLMVRTGNGFHIYTTSLMASHVELLNYPGIDVRSKGGYVVAPPSLHHTGNYYEWDSISTPEPLPDELLNAVNQGGGRTKASVPSKSKGSKANEPKEWTKLPAVIGPDYRIPDGRRGDVLYQIASRERGRGRNYFEIFNVLEKINNVNCDPPVPKSRLVSTAKSATKLSTNTEKRLAPKS